MVFYFECCKPEFMIYVGKDKYENEKLIAYGWPDDVWFHVDDLSSAHVYLRLPPGFTIDTIPQDVMNDCLQLTKANSIQGSKTPVVDVVYTMWANLRKDGTMDTGQVSFHDQRSVKMSKNVARDREILRRLEKTRREEYPDLEALREAHEREERLKKRSDIKDRKKKESLEIEESKKTAELRSYKSLMDEAKMLSNEEIKDFKSYEDDFM